MLIKLLNNNNLDAGNTHSCIRLLLGSYLVVNHTQIIRSFFFKNI